METALDIIHRSQHSAEDFVWMKKAAIVARALLSSSSRAAQLEEALKDARNYVDAVVANSGDTKRRANYRACVARIDAALSPEPPKETK